MSSATPSSQPFLQFTLGRAHQRFLPLLGRRLPAGDDAPLPVSAVTVEGSAVLILSDVLETGSVRTGMMFGRRAAARLSVTHITTGGYDGHSSLFGTNPAYALGVTDALRQVDVGIDWVGQWLTVPGDASAGELQRLRWADLAMHEGLLSPQHPLLIIGWREGVLDAQSVVSDEGVRELQTVRTVLRGPEL